MDTIAILGWGSLLWEEQEEFDRWHDQPWRNDGPLLRLEFSRVSSSRDGALTLVIDYESGAPCTVAWCASKRQSLEDVIADLRCREGTSIRNIGFVDLAGSKTRCREEVAEDTVKKWATEKQINSVVWTDLDSNFQKMRSTAFSVAEAISYLHGLDSKGKARAAEYVWRAPGFIQTPLRSALQVEPWFRDPSRVRSTRRLS
jgi:hypothetical protein